MKIQVDLPDKLNEYLKFYKIIKHFNTLQETIIYSLDDYFKKLNANEIFKIEKIK